MSVAFQMLAFGGKIDGLFRGAFMQSGAALRVGDITHGQVCLLPEVNDVPLKYSLE